MISQTPILVTGAAGCIGSWVIARLVGAGRPVVAFDLSNDRRRLYLALPREQADAVPWECGDITDEGLIGDIIASHGIGAVLHLAALQIPFCQCDPVAGARVNVVGTVNVFEAVRRQGLKRFCYASSAAALTPSGHDGPTTLYGIYKLADEGIARVYWQDWQVPSIGVRPHTVYGPGRDQGRTSAPTKAMLAAAAGKPFVMPYTGTLRMQHVHEVADAFIRCADAQTDGAFVGDLQGELATIPEIVAAIKQVVPDANITLPTEAITSSVEQCDGDLRAQVGAWARVPLEDGTRMTIEAFREILSLGRVVPDHDAMAP